VADLEWTERLQPSPPPFGGRADAVTPGHVSMLNFDRSTLKHGTQNIQNDCHIATSGFLTVLECTKFVIGRGSAPDPAGGAYSAPPDPLAG